jgi:hypothetical protein
MSHFVVVMLSADSAQPPAKMAASKCLRHTMRLRETEVTTRTRVPAFPKRVIANKMRSPLANRICSNQRNKAKSKFVSDLGKKTSASLKETVKKNVLNRKPPDKRRQMPFFD